MNSKVVGFLLGTVVAAAAGVAFVNSIFTDHNSSYEFGGGPDSGGSLLGWTLPIAGAGYLVAILIKAQSPTRRLGQGMLIGLTVMLPVAGALAIAYFFSQL